MGLEPGPAGCCRPASQVHSGLAKLLGNKEEEGRCPVLRQVPGSRDLGTGRKPAVCLQLRPQRGGNLQVAGGSWHPRGPPGCRKERVQSLAESMGLPGPDWEKEAGKLAGLDRTSGRQTWPGSRAGWDLGSAEVTAGELR